MANLSELCSRWRMIVENNDYIHPLFIFYQMAMLFSTCISPATVILIIIGSLEYARVGISETTAMVLLFMITIGYTLICLYTPQKFQLMVAKILTFFFAIVMAIAAVGIAAQAAQDVHDKVVNATTTEMPTDDSIASKLPFSVTTIYLFALIALFVAAALLHPLEAYCLVHGLWYLFCLPSGYLILIIYSICNLTDKSWGTREAAKKDDGESWQQMFGRKLRYVMSCCRPAPEQQPPPYQPPLTQETNSSPSTSETDSGAESPPTSNDQQSSATAPEERQPLVSPTSILKRKPPGSPRQPSQVVDDEVDGSLSSSFRYPGDYKVRFKISKDVGTSVQEWLAEIRMGCYTSNFQENGYDDTSFVHGMTLKDLKDIGIDIRGHRKKLIEEIKALPPSEIEQGVPDDVERWLINLGLDCYWDSFQQNGYTTSRELEDLKPMDKSTIVETLNIHKMGHVKKLLKALERLQYPSETQRRIRETRKLLEEVTTKTLDTGNLDQGKERYFWDGLRKTVLVPESAIFGHDTELKEKLSDMRDTALMMFAAANVLWMTIILALFKQTNLTLLDTNPIGLVFLIVYGSIMLIQFLCLLWHRISTVCHFLARAPWKRGKMYKNWAFDDVNVVSAPTQQEVNEFAEQHRRRTRRRRARRSQSEELYNPTEPLLGTRNLGHNNVPHYTEDQV